MNSEESGTRDLLVRAEDELARVAELTKQTLGFFRETSGAESQPLSEVVQSLVTLYTSRAGNKEVKISVQIVQDPAVYCIPGRSARWLQIFSTTASTPWKSAAR